MTGNNRRWQARHACSADFSMDSMESPEGSAEPGAEERAAPDDPVHELRTDWRFAAVIQFCRVFNAALKLRPFPADQLQAALLQPQEHSVFLQELVYRLLKNGQSALLPAWRSPPRGRTCCRAGWTAAGTAWACLPTPWARPGTFSCCRPASG